MYTPATFRRLVEIVLAGLHWETCLEYLDDIIVCGEKLCFWKVESSWFETEIKCYLFTKRVVFCGHLVSEEGVRTYRKKTEFVRNWPVTTNVKEVSSLLGFCSYYRRFVCRFAEISRSHHKLSEKGLRFKW